MKYPSYASPSLAFLNDEESTLEEIGKAFGLSRERIRQVETQALKKLQIRTS